MKFQYLMDRFEYYLAKYVNPKTKFKPKPYSTYFDDGAVQSQMDIAAVTNEFLPPAHQTTPPP